MDKNSEHISYKSDYITFGLLLILTALTVWASYATGGTTVLAVLVALGIATVKASFVVRNFMHLKYDATVYKIFVWVVLFLFAILIGLLAVDYYTR